MYRDDPRDKVATLSDMWSRALQFSNFDQNAAKEKVREWTQNDRRFDSNDHQRLVDRVQLSRSNGAVLDLSDPQLLKGGQPRPGDRRW
jgi:hypothetical protein